MIWFLVCLTCSRVGFLLGAILFSTHIFFSPSHFSWTPLPSLHDVSYSYDWSNSYRTGSNKVDYKKWKTLDPPYRVAGSMHSVSPLVSDTILVVPSGIIESNKTHVRAYAGTRLEDIQKHIAPYTMRGIGSILKQTLGGAFSTSLSGIETVSFTEFVEEIEYLTPQGLHRTTDLYHLKDSMGMVGIITEMTVRIFPNRGVEFHSEFRLPLDEVHKISGYEVVDAILEDELHVVAYNVTEVTNKTRSRPTGVAFLWDLFGLPLLIPSSIRRGFVKGSLKSKQALRTVGADAAMYGSMFVDYRIPLENCSAFLKVKTDAIVRVKYLQPRSDACLSYSGPTCKVEMYYTRFEEPVLFDEEAYVLGGYPHWGKLTGNVSRFLHRFPCFKDVPVQDEFLNGYLKGEAFTAWDGGHRVWWTRLWQVLSLCFIVLYTCTRTNGYEKLEAF